jgi:RND superfamily putative drug exporter
VAALHALRRMGREGQFKAIHVVVDTPGGAMRPAAQRAIYEFASAIAADPRVDQVRMIATHPAMAFMRPAPPPEIRNAFVSRDGARALIVVIPQTDLELRRLSELVRDLRAKRAPQGIAGFAVGGAAALNADYEDAVARWFPIVALIIVAATYLALALGYRSLVLPLKAVALNLISVGAALGALVLVFQDGVGAPWLIDRAYGGVFPNIPILVFSIVFGLSMDYEVFLFNRVVEAHRAGADDREAMAAALRATAGVITSAALIMICVFGAFFLGEFLLIRMLGFALAVAIAIDALIVRLVLGPAIFALAGRWNWWPGKAGERLPRRGPFSGAG